VATVTPQGLVTAVTPGTATITALVEGKTAAVSVTVALVPVQSVTITPLSSSLYVGQTLQLTAIARDSAGGILTGRAVTWSNVTPAVATVTPQGLVTAVTPGTATITALVEEKTAAVSVTVALVPVQSVTISPSNSSLNVGQTLQLAVIARDSEGGILTGRAVTWSNVTPAVATVTPQGIVTAITPGTATIAATVEGKTALASVTVAGVVTTVSIIPATFTLPATGTTLQLSVEVRDIQGISLAGKSVTWITSNPSVVTVSGSGLVTATGSGTATIRAVVEGISGQAIGNVSDAYALLTFNGTMLDASGNRNNGSPHGGVQFSADRLGRGGMALSFNGTDAFVRIASLDILPYKPITYSAWILATDVFPSTLLGNNHRVIVGRDQGCNVVQGALTLYTDPMYSAYNELIYYRGRDAIRSGYTIGASQWTHVALTIDELGFHRFYVNGAMMSVIQSLITEFLPVPFLLGAGTTPTSCITGLPPNRFFWKGSLDDVAVWRRVLSALEIRDLAGSFPYNP
jgi:uncharacterized protein YjdB